MGKLGHEGSSLVADTHTGVWENMTNNLVPPGWNILLLEGPFHSGWIPSHLTKK